MELYLRARQVHLCNPKTQGSLGRQTTGQPGLHRKTQSKKKKITILCSQIQTRFLFTNN